MVRVSLTLNGRPLTADVDERTLLVELIRDVAGQTGTHAGCWEARCGCCAVLLDGGAVKSCNVLAAQADGASIVTIEGLSQQAPAAAASTGGAVYRRRIDEAVLHPLQAAFRDHGAVQCGFCTPGMLIVLLDFLQRTPDPSADEIREAIRGNLCRCTGYQRIVDAALDGAARMRAAQGAPAGR
ncbi:MAG: (2Fe-2S)-binding protein [Candidatus Binatia bacterium]